MDILSSSESRLDMTVPDPALPEIGGMPRKPRVWTVFAAWLAAIVAGYIAVFASIVAVGFVMGFVMGAQGIDAATIQARVVATLQQPLPLLVLSLLPFQMGIAAVAIFAARRSQVPFRERLGLLPQSGRTYGPVRLMGLAGFSIASALVIGIACILLLGKAPSSPVETALGNNAWWSVAVMGVLLSLVPAVVEEILFRGYIQRRLLQRWSPAVAIGTSTLLFAVIHADSLQHILSVIPVGLVLGLLAYRTNSIKPAILVHAVYNATVTGFAAFTTLMIARLGEETAGLMVIGVILVLGLMGLPAVVSLLRRSRSPEVDLPMVLPAKMEPVVG